jgi:hypothetical protein
MHGGNKSFNTNNINEPTNHIIKLGKGGENMEICET